MGRWGIEYQRSAVPVILHVKSTRAGIVDESKGFQVTVAIIHREHTACRGARRVMRRGRRIPDEIGQIDVVVNSRRAGQIRYLPRKVRRQRMVEFKRSLGAEESHGLCSRSWAIEF